jgi:ribosome-associated protein
VTPEELKKRIPESEFVFIASRSGGPGGQNVNKVNTKVSLYFDVVGSEFLNQDEKKMILERLSNRISKSGVLSVVASEHRTQQANKISALQRLENLLAHALQQPRKRYKTRPTKKSRERRLQAKQQRSLLKKQRKRTGNDSS